MRLLGHPLIEGRTGQPCQPRGQKSWALLARVALAERPLTRGELAAELFGEANDPLGALRWCLADLRRCCGDPELLRGDPVRLTVGSLWLDVWALQDGTLPAADIGGELLAGVEPRDCPAFGMWLMLARGRCAARSQEELHQVALRLLAAGDAEAAASLAGRAAAQDVLEAPEVAPMSSSRFSVYPSTRTSVSVTVAVVPRLAAPVSAMPPAGGRIRLPF